MNKQEIFKAAEKRTFIKDVDFKCCYDLDGSEAKRYLESKGFEVISFGDLGTNGYALTKEGIYLSTNGFICLEENLEERLTTYENLKASIRR